MNESSASPEPEIPHDGLAELGGLSPRDLFVDGLRTPAAAGQWEPPSAEHVARLLPQFRVEALIGHGGMGAVYRAAQPRLDRFVAIKLLPAELAANDEFVARFEREARTLAKLHHPHIVGIHDFGQTTEGHLYFVMEFVDGTDLARIIATGSLGATQALELTAQICEALQYAHSQHVIHRDIKPANVLVTQEGQAKLADFGLARPLSEVEATLTASHLVMGTPDYMAPEQRAGLGDHRVDIYALGVMLYEMLTGRRPRGVFDPPSMKVKVDVRLDEVVVKAMREEPERRYQQASEMRLDVDHIRTTPQPKGQKKKPEEKAAAKPAPEKAPTRAVGTRRGRSTHPAWVLPLVAVTALIGLAFFMVNGGWLSSTGSKTATKPPTSSGEGFAAANKDQPFINSLGMKFVPIPGSRLLFSVWKTRVQDYTAYARANKVDEAWTKQTKDNVPVSREPLYPVCGVNWHDANAFCKWLTETETSQGKLPQGAKYRIPTDLEWNDAAGIQRENGETPEQRSGINQIDFPWGAGFPPKGMAGNYADTTYHEHFPKGGPWLEGYNDGFATTAPVGSFAPNKYGLHDLGGNLWEWCDDWYDKEQKSRVLRGASWSHSDRSMLLLSFRGRTDPASRANACGFRCLLEPPPSPTAPENRDATAAKASASPSSFPRRSTRVMAEATKDLPFENQLGMKFVPVPGTNVLFCIHETRKGDYAAYANANLGTNTAWKKVSWNGEPVSQDDSHPVVMVNWDDANAFCAWLSKREGLTYRLPKDREWSWAVGIASRENADLTPGQLNERIPSEYPWGTTWPPPKDAGNYSDDQWKRHYPDQEPDGFPTTSPVMSFKPNSLGIYDLGGNVWEWCQEWWDSAQAGRILRGSSWLDFGTRYPLSSRRIFIPPHTRSDHYGFRCAVELGDKTATSASPSVGVRELPTTPPPRSPNAPDASASGGRWISLLPKIDPKTDTTLGRWSPVAGGLQAQAVNGQALLELPYEPPAEYDFHVAFTATDTRAETIQVLRAGGHNFRWTTNGFSDARAGFDMIGNTVIQNSPAAVSQSPAPELRRRYESLVEVRRDRVTGYIDGRKLVEWKTDYSNMNLVDALTLRNPKRLALAIWSGTTVFHEISVREVTGKGIILTPDAPATTNAPALEQPFVNSLGMKFLPVPIVGGPSGGHPVLFSIWETRVQDYEFFVKETGRPWDRPKFPQGPTHAATTIGYEDAQAFCTWLTLREHKGGKLVSTAEYRLPTDHEWSCAVGIGDREDPAKAPFQKDGAIPDVYPWGSVWPPPKGAGNHGGTETTGNFIWGGQLPLYGYQDDFPYTAPAGSFPPNRFGLHDLSGNVWEWCSDWYDSDKSTHPLRGGSFAYYGKNRLLSCFRASLTPTTRLESNGFRVVLVKKGGAVEAASSPSAATPNTDEGFVQLWDDKHFQGWSMCGSGNSEVKEGVITLSATSGREGCFWYAPQQFRNFHLKVEFKIPEAGGNSGIYVRMPYIGKDMNLRLQSYQVDVSDLPYGMEATGAICGAKAPSSVPLSPLKWNSLEFTVVGQHYEVWLNGIQVNSFDGNKASSGHIGFQLYKKQVQYRNLLIKELSP